MDGELKYIFIQIKIIFILTLFSITKHSSSLEGVCTQLPCKTKKHKEQGGLRWKCEQYVCLCGESLYVGLASGAQIVVVASW